MLTNEELTYPRFKVLVDYPNSNFSVGQVILFNHKEDWFTGKPEWTSEPTISKQGGKTQFYIGSIEGYTDVFKRLEWYEERTQQEMPKYIKFIYEGAYIERLITHGIDEADGTPYFTTRRFGNQVFRYHKCLAEPATKQEWMKFLQKNNPLLKPRYIVQLDYPDSPYSVGRVISDPAPKDNKRFVSYPKIFKKLEWWENRPENELPDYVRNRGSSVIYKATYPTIGTLHIEDISGHRMNTTFTNLDPATIDEWDDYKEFTQAMETQKKPLLAILDQFKK